MMKDYQKFVRAFPGYGIAALMVLAGVCASIQFPPFSAWYLASVSHMLMWYLFMIGGVLGVLTLGMLLEYLIYPRLGRNGL